MANKTIKWIPASDEAAQGDKKITSVSFVADAIVNQLKPGPVDETTPLTNHWLIFLVIADNKFIQVDAIPMPPGMNMTVMCTAKPRSVLSDANKSISAAITGDFTVKKFFDMLTEHKYDQYKFTEHGTGCRYWVYCVAELLRKQDMIDEADFQNIEDALEKVWQGSVPVAPGNQTTLDSGKGTFTA